MNDETIVIAQTEADRAMVFNEFNWMIGLYEEQLSGEAHRTALPCPGRSGQRGSAQGG